MISDAELERMRALLDLAWSRVRLEDGDSPSAIFKKLLREFIALLKV